METRTEVLHADNGATLEVVTVTSPTGHEFSAHGAIIDFENGYAFAYVHEDVPPKTGAGWGQINRQYASSGKLVNWQGETIGHWVETGRWKQYGSWETVNMRSVRCTLSGDERAWIGRYGCDWSSAVRLRPSRANA